MVTRVTADEVSEFRTAVAGVVIDWVRTDEGFGPATMVSAGDDRAAVSVGGVDFSTLLHTEIPDDRLVFQYVTSAPPGMSWCGSDGENFDLRQFRPGAAVFGNVPAGSRAVTLTTWLDPLQAVADDLGLGDLRPPPTVEALPATPEMRGLGRMLSQLAERPGLLEADAGSTAVLEAAARAVASVDGIERSGTRRGFDSRQIVADCLEHAAATGNHQPAISELCAVALASESRLRQAFIEILGVPPVQYFQIRSLSRLRDELLAADPGSSTVTRTATSLGLTQLGRVAGRYRSLFGETPSETLRRHRRHRF